MPFAARLRSLKAERPDHSYARIASMTGLSKPYVAQIIADGALPKKRKDVESLAKVFGLVPSTCWAEVLLDRMEPPIRNLVVEYFRLARSHQRAKAAAEDLHAIIKRHSPEMLDLRIDQASDRDVSDLMSDLKRSLEPQDSASFELLKEVFSREGEDVDELLDAWATEAKPGSGKAGK
jgi:hypothetical protein